MSLEARISGPIFQEALSGLRERKSVEMGRSFVPGINASLNALVDAHATRGEDGEFIHDGAGWAKITMYVNPSGAEEEVAVNLIRHVRSKEKRVDVFVEGLGSYIHVGQNICELRTVKQIPQRERASYESMRIPAGSSMPSAPHFDKREANLDEVRHIKDFVDVLTDPSQVKRVKGLTS